MKPVVWGVLSVSKHYTLRVQPALRNSAFATVGAIASRSLDKAKEAAARLGIERAYGSYEELLRDPEVEAVYIPLPNNLHAEWIKKCADAGKHVLCEKPLAMNAAEAEEAVRYAEGKGVRVMEAFMHRFHPQWRRVKEIVNDGELGEIHFVHIHQAFSNRDPNNIRNILEAGGGALMDIGCYAASSARFVLGREPSRAIALVERDPAFGTDIISSGILDFGRARAVFTVSTTSWPGQRVDIRGTEGDISVMLPVNMFTDVPAEVRVTTRIASRTLTLGPADQYLLMFEAYGRALREGRPVPTPPKDAIANMRVIDALFRSEKSGSWETVG
jgi:predicted dehydrogenase